MLRTVVGALCRQRCSSLISLVLPGCLPPPPSHTHPQPNGTIASGTLVTAPSSTTGWDNWYGSAAQASSAVALAEGQPVLLEAASCNTAGNSSLQVVGWGWGGDGWGAVRGARLARQQKGDGRCIRPGCAAGRRAPGTS